MSAAIPTLGYPSRTDAVLALRGKGMSTEEIAEAIGIKNSTVTSLECHAGKRKGAETRKVQGNRTVLFPIDVLESLRPLAEQRGISANELARRIVEAVVDDNLVKAVLDDGED